jgi:hypothetical protein
MRAIRLAVAALIALALAALPVAGAVIECAEAAPETGMHTGMSAPDACPCCDATQDRAAVSGVCHLKCCCAAILVEGQPPMAEHAGPGVDTVAAGLPRFLPPPDPPPPRS